MVFRRHERRGSYIKSFEGVRATEKKVVNQILMPETVPGLVGKSRRSVGAGLVLAKKRFFKEKNPRDIIARERVYYVSLLSCYFLKKRN